MKKLLSVLLALSMPLYGLDLAFTIQPPPPEDQVVKYHVYVSHETNTFRPMMIVRTNTMVYISNVRPGRYRYYLIAEDINGNLSIPSEAVEVAPVPSRPVLNGSWKVTGEERVASVSPPPETNHINLRSFYGRNKERPYAKILTNALGEQIAPYPNEVLTRYQNIDASKTNQEPATYKPEGKNFPTNEIPVPVPMPPLPL